MSSDSKVVSISEPVHVCAGINYSKNETVAGYLDGIAARNARLVEAMQERVVNSCACGLCEGTGFLWESVQLSFTRKSKALARVKRLVVCLACVGTGYDVAAVCGSCDREKYAHFAERLGAVQAVEASL